MSARDSHDASVPRHDYGQRFVDYYATLGVKMTASPQEISSRYAYLTAQASAANSRDRLSSALERFCAATGRDHVAPGSKQPGPQALQQAYWVLTKDRGAYDSAYRRQRHGVAKTQAEQVANHAGIGA